MWVKFVVILCLWAVGSALPNGELSSSKYSEVVVLPDTHGDVDAMIRSLWLARSKIEPDAIEFGPFLALFKTAVFKDLPEQQTSSSVNVVVVQLGDLIDRGPYGYECIKVLNAIPAILGWDVRRLYGNHEVLAFMGQSDGYVNPKEYKRFHGKENRDAVYRPGHPLYESMTASFLGVVRLSSTRDEVSVRDRRRDPRTLFVHGGINLDWLNFVLSEAELKDLHRMNQAVRHMATQSSIPDVENLLSEDQSIVWTRLLAESSAEVVCRRLIDPILDHFQVARVIVGHTPQSNRRVNHRCGGKIILADVMMSRWMTETHVNEARMDGGRPVAVIMKMAADGTLDSIIAHYADLATGAEDEPDVIFPMQLPGPALARSVSPDGGSPGPKASLRSVFTDAVVGTVASAYGWLTKRAPGDHDAVTARPRSRMVFQAPSPVRTARRPSYDAGASLRERSAIFGGELEQPPTESHNGSPDDGVIDSSGLRSTLWCDPRGLRRYPDCTGIAPPSLPSDEQVDEEIISRIGRKLTFEILESPLTSEAAEYRPPPPRTKIGAFPRVELNSFYLLEAALIAQTREALPIVRGGGKAAVVIETPEVESSNAVLSSTRTRSRRLHRPSPAGTDGELRIDVVVDEPDAGTSTAAPTVTYDAEPAVEVVVQSTPLPRQAGREEARKSRAVSMDLVRSPPLSSEWPYSYSNVSISPDPLIVMVAASSGPDSGLLKVYATETKLSPILVAERLTGIAGVPAVITKGTLPSGVKIPNTWRGQPFLFVRSNSVSTLATRIHDRLYVAPGLLRLTLVHLVHKIHQRGLLVGFMSSGDVLDRFGINEAGTEISFIDWSRVRAIDSAEQTNIERVLLRLALKNVGITI